ncbi:MAG: hypothetical protein RIG62_05795 [Cyclobacteriaceae bacterium]
MRNIFLSAGLATAVICSAQAQETQPSSTQQAIEKQEQALETLKEAVEQQEQALEELKSSETDAQAMNTDVETDTQIEGDVDVYEQDNEVERTSAETALGAKEAATETTYQAEEEAQEAGQEAEATIEKAGKEVEQSVEAAGQEVTEEAKETEQAMETSTEEVGQEMEETAQETEQAIESSAKEVEESTQETKQGAEEMKEEGQAMKSEAKEEMTETTQAMESTTQTAQDTAQNARSEFNSQDLKQITEAELPQEVKDSFDGSDFSEATIEQAYEISGATVAQILESRANASQYPGTEVPEKLYQLQVKEKEGAAILYIGDDGEIIASESM